MASVSWSSIVEQVQPHVVRIFTPHGSGTGFLVSNNTDKRICGIATAAHVIDHAHDWLEPIRIVHESSNTTILVQSTDRAVFLDSQRDTAAILIDGNDIPFPTEPLPLAPKDKYLKIGNTIAWLGYPAIPSANLCFFSGSISAWVQEESAYLVDGVAINGVSGGPAIWSVMHGMELDDSEISKHTTIVGVVSAYMPNRATGETLPGLSVVRGVDQYHKLLAQFESVEQAQEKETPPEDTLAGINEGAESDRV
ncbi:MAG: hypothetical protein AMXMBFR82_46690 [Candidatus Hydrogenedentota bacterium]